MSKKSKLKSEPPVRCIRLVKQHVELLQEILEHQIANLDNPHGHEEFYRCYTYNTGDMPAWVKKAKRLVLLNAAGEPQPPTMTTELQLTCEAAVRSSDLLCFGVPCDLQAWLDSPERVMRHVRDGMTAREINRSRWGSAVDVRVDVEDLKACARHGLVRCEKSKWFILHNIVLDGGNSEVNSPK